jgi:hypothetical protein
MITSLLIGLAALAQAPADDGQALAFSIRADPSIAEDINRVLGDVATPTVTVLPPGDDATAFLATLCGGRTAPALLSLRTLPGSSETVARHTPCLRVARDQRFPVRDGNTLY